MSKVSKIPRKSLIFTLVMLIFLFLPQGTKVLADKSYSIKSLTINADIVQDGSMEVSQTFLMNFSGGQFSKVYVDIPMTGNLKTGSRTAIENVEVYEGNKKYSITNDTENKPEGHYNISNNGDTLHVEWYHRSENQDRTFTLKYKIVGGITSYNDTADLYYKFVGEGWEIPINNINITVKLPMEVSRDKLKVFGHGPLYGNVKILDDSSARWSLDKLPSRTYLECRMLFPKEAIPQNKTIVNADNYNEAMSEELQAAKRADLQKKQDFIFMIVGIIDVLLAIALSIFYYMKYKKRYKVPDLPIYMRELPDDLTPAEVNAFVKGGFSDTSAISATVLELARKKYISFEKSNKDTLMHVVNLNTEELNSHEKILLEFLKGVDLYGKGIKKYVSHHQEGARKFFNDFKSEVKGSLYGRHIDFFEEAPSLSVVLPILFICLNILLIVFAKETSVVIIPFSVMSIIAASISFAFLKRRSFKGESHFGNWMAFKHFLKDFSNLDKADLPEIAIWEHYLVYAASLGVAKEALRNLRAAYPEVSDNYYGYWYNGYFGYYYMGGGQFGRGDEFSFFDNLVHDLDSSFRNAYTSSMPSSTGGGGGFSGGGGFGGGGGGGGAS